MCQITQIVRPPPGNMICRTCRSYRPGSILSALNDNMVIEEDLICSTCGILLILFLESVASSRGLLLLRMGACGTHYLQGVRDDICFVCTSVGLLGFDVWLGVEALSVVCCLLLFRGRPRCSRWGTVFGVRFRRSWIHVIGLSLQTIIHVEYGKDRSVR